MSKKSYVLTDGSFKNGLGFEKMQQAMNRSGVSSRQYPDFCLEQLEMYKDSGGTLEVFLPHWHQITDDDGRSIRNLLNANGSNNYDLLRYLSLTLQISDEEYAAYVQNWCNRQIMCIDDLEEPLKNE